MTNLCGYCGTYPGKACNDCQTFFDGLDDPPGHPKGHPPAAKLGPVIFLPPAYTEHWDRWNCEACGANGDLGNTCHDCREDLADSEAERWADGRREGDE